MTATANPENAAKSDSIRAQMPATLKHAYLNTGTFGPMSTPAIEAMLSYQRDELEEGRLGEMGYPRAGEAKKGAREAIARLFGANVNNIALTRHTTDGMNVGINGLNWQSGDELIITDMEHPGGQVPAYNVARRYGVVIRLARLSDGSGDVVGALESLISPRTRMIVFSHLTWNTGTVMPVAEIAEMAHRHHVLTVCDAAQGAGSVPINLPASGVDVYGMPGQKWLCGPEGTGAVYVSDAALDVIQPTTVGYASLGGALEHQGGYFLPAHGAARFEVGGSSGPMAEAQKTAVEFMLDTVGADWAFERIASLGHYAWEQLSKVNGVSMITPPLKMAGLNCFTIEGVEPGDIVEKLRDRGVLIRSIHGPDCCRVSTGYYNNEEDVDRLVAGVEEIARPR